MLNKLSGSLVKTALTALILIAFIAAAGFSAAGTRTFKVPIEQFELANGLRVVLSEDHSAPVVAVVVCYDAGSRNETRGRTGFAHLFEHMMFQGSENVGKAEHFKYIEGNGGIMNASTYQDRTVYYNLLPSNQLELALWLESDRMRSLKITDENLKNQKEAVKEEKRLSYDNQAYWPALLKMDQMVFSNWTNSHSTIGSMEDLDAATVADVRAFFEIYYAPNNAVLAIAGDIDAARARPLVAKYFDSIPRGKKAPEVDVSEPAGVKKQREIADDPLAETPAVAIAWKIPPRRTPDFYAIVLLKAILFDGESSRLYQKLIKDKAISLDLEATLEERRGPGQLSIVTKYKQASSAEQVRSVIDSEIQRIRRDGVSSDEIIKARNQIRLGRFACPSSLECTSLQGSLGRAIALAEHTLFDGDPSLINSEIDRYLEVTADRVQQAALKYFVNSNAAVLFIRPSRRDPAAAKESAGKGSGS
jgi:predicted Zn-dependent peptidase